LILLPLAGFGGNTIEVGGNIIDIEVVAALEAVKSSLEISGGECRILSSDGINRNIWYRIF